MPVRAVPLSQVTLEDTVLYYNTAAEGAGIALQNAEMVTRRSFIYLNSAHSAEALLEDISCVGGSIIKEEKAGKHWRRLGFDLVELETCSCCSGCHQMAPTLVVDQVTLTADGDAPPRPMLVLQGSFLTYGENSDR
eukprot:SAG22_NODE_375_length_11547_cov_12.885657_9_plen_136_part_00